MTTPQQTRAIHALRRQIPEFDEAAYRGLLKSEFKVASSSDLDERRAGRLIERLKGLAGAGARVGRRAASDTVTTQPALQALWISLWALGAARSRDDRALIEFVKRQTGREHPRFLTPAETAKVIEALRAWARRAGVDWSESDDPKICVARAVLRACVADDAFTPSIPGADPWPLDVQHYGGKRGLPGRFEDYAPADWDRLIVGLGERLRAKRHERLRAKRRMSAKARAEREAAPDV